MGDSMHVVQLEVYFHKETLDEAMTEVKKKFRELGFDGRIYNHEFYAFRFFDNCDIFDKKEFRKVFDYLHANLKMFGIRKMYAYIWEMDTDEPTERLEM